MALIQTVRNETSGEITLRIPGINPRDPLVIPASTARNLLDFVSVDELEALQSVLESMVASGSLSVQLTVDRTTLNIRTLTDDVNNLSVDTHTHANKALLDTYTQTDADIESAVDDDHIHANKALLDTYTQTEADLDDAVTKKHDGAAQDTAIGLKATKTTAIVASDSDTIAAADSAVTAIVDAPVQTGSYVQADVEAIRALANDLKAKYNVAVTTINELKTDYNTAVTLINELKAKIDTMNT